MTALVGYGPIGRLYFSYCAGLPPRLAALASSAVAIGILWTGFETFLGYTCGFTLKLNALGRSRTHLMAEANFLYCMIILGGFLLGAYGFPSLGMRITGVYWYMACLTVGSALQGFWLARRLGSHHGRS
jgi:hypothetical protein